MRLLICLFFLSGGALAADAPKRPKELMKCTSAKFGTLWVSFGTVWQSGAAEPRYFPTEIAYFGPDSTGRARYPDWREGLKVPVQFGGHFLHMEFKFAKNGAWQTQLLQVIQQDPRDDAAFLGNWTISEPGQPEQMDLAACSLD